jgi:hypothetical protein
MAQRLGKGLQKSTLGLVAGVGLAVDDQTPHAVLAASRSFLAAVPLPLLLALASPASGQGVLQPGFDQALLGSVGASRAWGVAVADFTSDGIPDVVAGSTNGDVLLFRGRGDGLFDAIGRVINMTFNDAYAIVAADFDRDGRQDFALATTSGSAVPDGSACCPAHARGSSRNTEGCARSRTRGGIPANPGWCRVARRRLAPVDAMHRQVEVGETVALRPVQAEAPVSSLEASSTTTMLTGPTPRRSWK